MSVDDPAPGVSPTQTDAADNAEAPAVDWSAYVAYPQIQTPPVNRRRRRIFRAVSAAWVLALLAGGIWYAHHGQATVREQTTIAQAEPTVDRAIGQVVTAAGAGVVPAISGYAKTSDCSVTPIRPGVTYERQVRLFTRPGDEPALLDRIAAGLPADYHASVTHPETDTGDRLRADAGDYVALRGTVPQRGLVLVVADTGCRTLGHRPATDPTAAPPATDRATIDTVLGSLGVTGVTWSVHQLPCGLRTIEARSGPGQTIMALPEPSATTVVRTDNLFADPGGIAVQVDGDRTVVTDTTGTCR